MILINTGLTGPLSPAVAAAGKTLQRLYLGSNALTGDLTPAIRALNGSALRLLDIDSNNLDSVVSCATHEAGWNFESMAGMHVCWRSSALAAG